MTPSLLLIANTRSLIVPLRTYALTMVFILSSSLHNCYTVASFLHSSVSTDRPTTHFGYSKASSVKLLLLLSHSLIRVDRSQSSLCFIIQDGFISGTIKRRFTFHICGLPEESCCGHSAMVMMPKLTNSRYQNNVITAIHRIYKWSPLMFNEDFSWELREKWDLFGLLGSPSASTANMHFGLIIPRTCLCFENLAITRAQIERQILKVNQFAALMINYRARSYLRRRMKENFIMCSSVFTIGNGTYHR